MIAPHGDWSLVGLAGTTLQNLVIINPSLGLTDLGTISAGSGVGTLEYLDVSGIAGETRIQIAPDSLAPDAVVVGGSGGVVIDRLTGRHDGAVSVNTGNGDDRITFGGSMSAISSGLGRDIFLQTRANAGQLNGLTTITVGDQGRSDDVVELLHPVINQNRTVLHGSQTAEEFWRQVRGSIQTDPTAAGLFVEVLISDSGFVTYAYLNTGQESLDHILALTGNRNPQLVGSVLNLG
jgi:hypothetical protein